MFAGTCGQLNCRSRLGSGLSHHILSNSTVNVYQCSLQELGPRVHPGGLDKCLTQYLQYIDCDKVYTLQAHLTHCEECDGKGNKIEI